MRRTLSAVRVRVERLAAQVDPSRGCPTCHEDEKRARLHWHCIDDDQTLADELATLPQSATCATCGRTYGLEVTVVKWLVPCDAPGCTCDASESAAP